MHSRYGRTLADLPWHGTAVRLHVQTRRFFCDASDCQRRIFAERLDRTTAAYARRTHRLGSAQDILALALGGEAGARVAGTLRMLTSADTLLRRVRALPDPALEPVRILGVDDWAWRKGHRYGTLLADLERGRVVDLLPDREADTLAAWLKAHPGVEVIARDRAGAYADGASRGAPNAVQVADRWHLLRNLTDAVERLLDGQSALLREATKALGWSSATSDGEAPSQGSAPDACPGLRQDASARRRAARLERYRDVVALHERGVPKRMIARQLGLSRQTVIRWIRAGTFPERKPRAPAASQLDPYRPYLKRRVREGCPNAARLHRELRRDGFRGGVTIVREAVRQLKTEHPATPTPRVRRPSVRRTAWLLCLAEDDIPEAQRPYVEALTRMSPELDAARRTGREFVRVLTVRDADGWDAWITEAKTSPLRGFAEGLLPDEAAVRAAAELPWSTSPVEGHINRVKLVKRSMYGRAGFDLLRTRVLHAA